MFRFLLSGLLALTTAPAIRAQAVTEQHAPVAPSQAVVLNLKFANTIRVRPATDGQLRVRATVNINQNTLNDAFRLNLSRTDSQLTVTADLDQQHLAQAAPGTCPDSASWYYGGKNSARVCADIVCEVTLPANTSLHLSTINGNVEVQGLTGPLSARSISGFVDVSWPANRSAQVALKSITGEVYTSPSVAFQPQRYSSPVGYEVRSTLRGGTGPALRLESISGNVFFREVR